MSGVETEAQAAFLRCEEAQGFLYALPQPASEFEEYLKARQLAQENRLENQDRAKLQTT
jgi:EAL domain-containing protein (putative c-di-GMP-specific phosphodiesterase class I)